MGGWRHERSRHAAQGAKREADCALQLIGFSNVSIAAHFALTRSPRRRGRGGEAG